MWQSGFWADGFWQFGFWAESEQPPKPADNGWLGGGFGLRDHFQSTDDLRAERERLGIVPAEVARVVEVVARIEARKPAAEIECDAAQAVEALRAEIESEALAWRDFYADLLREAVQRLIDEEIRWRLKAIIDEQDEEQAILLMLSEM